MTILKTMTTRVLVALLMVTSSVGLYRSPGIIHLHEDTGTGHVLHFLPRPPHPERGYMKNCGPHGGFYNISWSPRQLNPTDRIIFYATFVAPLDFDRFLVVGELQYEGAHMGSINQWFSCSDLVTQLNAMFPREMLSINCPIRKGELISGSFLFTGTQGLIGLDGQYNLRASVRNKSGHEVMCISIDVEVLPFPDY
ncbi:uncharacterized protein LOC143287741 isoform X2 [Babylonia areolata]